MCGRDASDWFTTLTGLSALHGYDWINDGNLKICRRCGEPANFQSVQEGIQAKAQELETRYQERREWAKQLGSDKQQVLQEWLWPEIKEALSRIGATFYEADPNQPGSSLNVTVTAEGHTFHFTITSPLVTYGCYTSPPFEIDETKPYWAK
jgi:hypothetical protein